MPSQLRLIVDKTHREGSPSGFIEVGLVPMIDGRDALREMWDGIGRDPDDLLGPGSPLLPGPEPRDAMVLRCRCGEEGCGALVARIRGDGDEIVWDGFRDATAHDFEGARPVEPGREFCFDAQQYLGELRRCDADRDWEWPDRTTARLVRELLQADAAALAALGYRFGWASPGTSTPMSNYSPSGVSVSLWRGDRQIVLGFPEDQADPVDRARRIHDLLLNADPEHWPVTFRGGVSEGGDGPTTGDRL